MHTEKKETSISSLGSILPTFTLNFPFKKGTPIERNSNIVFFPPKMFGFLYTQISQLVGLLLLTFVSVRVDWMEFVHHPEIPFGFSKYFADGQHRCVIQSNIFRQKEGKTCTTML
ncbi:Uncharacterized protein APZ42_026534 [Daphnia magna]|uniref:Uncharacterized protein n=2 Tax=Daphnia magna TaxID=35525 RepID=A0A164S5W0_9CRUS|nr:hypothetical protein OUZ56_007450 [Daphnia magna]KZS09286.1 Uncharacterized protein APZ42_026534 [Daphnia magna]